MMFRRQIFILLLFSFLIFAQGTELKTDPERFQTLCTAFGYTLFSFLSGNETDNQEWNAGAKHPPDFNDVR